MNKYLYLPSHSYHTTHNKSGFIKGEGIRYAKTSTNPRDFKYFIELFKLRLQRRGCTLAFINKSLKQIKWKYRHKYLQPKTKTKNIPFLFKICYNPIMPHKFLRECLDEFTVAIKDIDELPKKMSSSITKLPPNSWLIFFLIAVKKAIDTFFYSLYIYNSIHQRQ